MFSQMPDFTALEQFSEINNVKIKSKLNDLNKKCSFDISFLYYWFFFNLFCSFSVTIDSC